MTETETKPADALAEAASLRRALDRVDREEREQVDGAVERAKARAERKREELLGAASPKARALVETAGEG